jgi:tetratricopeptide (TPR) repeat protein
MCGGRFQLGRARQASGDLVGAAAALTKAAQLGEASANPSFDALFALGGCLQASGQFAAAGAAFVEAAAVGAPPGRNKATRELDCVHNYGLTLLAQNLYDDAGLVFEQVSLKSINW